jgi:hypothetical protein
VSKKLPNISELTECPYCGSGSYYYLSAVFGHTTTWVNFDGSEADNAEMYSGVGYRPLKFVFCAECEKKIARLED